MSAASGQDPAARTAGPPGAPRRVALIDPLDTGHHASYAMFLAAELTRAGVSVHIIGTAAMVEQVRTAAPQATGEVLKLYPGSAAEYYGLKRLARERLNRQFHRAALQRAQAQGCELAHYLYLDSYILPLLSVLATTPHRGLAVRATLHWAYFMREFRVGSGGVRAEAINAAMLKALGRLGVRVQLHSRALVQQLTRRVGEAMFDYAPYPVEPPHAPLAERPAIRARVRQQFSIPEQAPVMLAFGGTRHDKGSDLAIQALGLLPEHHLLVVGPTRSFDAERFRALAQAQGIGERLHLLLEHVPDEDVEGYFLAADMVVLPYRRSFAGQSGPLMIGGALGIPVLASDVSVLTETIQAYRLGALFPAEDPQAMAQAVRTFDFSAYDPESARFGQDHLAVTFARAVMDSYRQPGRQPHAAHT